MPRTEIYERPTVPDEPYYDQINKVERARQWGGILLIVGVVWLVFELTGRGAFFGLNVDFAERTEQIDKVIASNTLIVDVANDDIELVQWDQADIRIEATKHAFGWNGAAAAQALNDFQVQIQPEGDAVRVTTQSQPDLHFGRSPYAKLAISVPADVQLDVQSTNGDIVISGVSGSGTLQTTNGDIIGQDVAGQITWKTTTGNIQLDRYEGAGTIETVNGDTRLNDGQDVDITANSVNGEMIFENMSGRLEVSTINGDIQVEDARDVQLLLRTAGGDIDMQDIANAQLAIETTAGDVEFSGSLTDTDGQRIQSFAGDIELVLPQTSNIQVTASTLSGDLESDFNLRSSAREMSGVIGDGGTSLIIDTTSGDIAITAD